MIMSVYSLSIPQYIFFLLLLFGGGGGESFAFESMRLFSWLEDFLFGFLVAEGVYGCFVSFF